MAWRHVRTRWENTPWRVALSFFLLGVVNNVLYVIILSAALDLVGPEMPKAVVLLANILPSVVVKSLAPYVFPLVPPWMRVAGVVGTNVVGMSAVGLGRGLRGKLAGIAMASAASGAGELTFLQATDGYPAISLAAWSSGTGGAGILGGVLYVASTTWWRISPARTILASAALPLVMAGTYFILLPAKRRKLSSSESRQEQHLTSSQEVGEQRDITEERVDDGDDDDDDYEGAIEGRPLVTSRKEAAKDGHSISASTSTTMGSIGKRISMVKPLILPYMGPLFLVYFAEYTINQGLSPTLLFDLADMPFGEYRDAYPTYSTLYQVGVFLSRSSSSFVRIRRLYVPALNQCVLLVVMLSQALFFFIPSIHVLFGLILLEGIFGGLVYVNAFHNISESPDIEDSEREFSIGVVGVSDSFGILMAALFSLWLEPAVCRYQVADGRPWCTLE